MFGGGVESEPGEGDFAGDGADVDDHAVAAFAHAGDGELGEVEGGEEVELEHVADGFVVGLPGGLIEADAGVVDEDIDAAVVGEGGFDEVAAKIRVGEVAGDGEVAGLSGMGLGGDGAGGESEAGAALGEFGGEGLADAAGCARDEGHLAFNAHCLSFRDLAKQ